MRTSTWLAGESVDAIRAQLDPVLAAIGWSVSFSDRGAAQWSAPVAERFTNHSYPFVIPSVDWHVDEPHHIEATDFDAKLYRAANVFDLMAWLGLAWLGLAWLGLAWLARQALDVRMHDRRAIVAAKDRRRRARRAAE
jgi:hypothetical protein